MKIFGITSCGLQAKIYIVIAETLEQANNMVNDAECWSGENEVLWVYEVDPALKPEIVDNYRPDLMTSSVIMMGIKAEKYSGELLTKSSTPSKCYECGNDESHFFNLKKGHAIKWHVCHECAEKLKNQGWTVYRKVLKAK